MSDSVTEQDPVKVSFSRGAGKGKIVAVGAILLIVMFAFYVILGGGDAPTSGIEKRTIELNKAVFQPITIPQPQPEVPKIVEVTPPRPEAKPVSVDDVPLLAYRSSAAKEEKSKEAGEGLSSAFIGSSFERVKATKLENPSMTITAGELLPCIMETAINSSLVGFIRCRITQDIYSSDGKVVLLDEGTKVVGEYRGALREGDDRLMIIWSRAETPDGVLIDLASPGTGELGEAGVGGAIDRRFAIRFGNAIMVSLLGTGVDISMASVEAAANKASQVVSVKSGSEARQSSYSHIAEQEHQRGLDIKPILRKKQGDVIKIFIARDLDFADVYDLEVVAGR